jgi:hypothetical protein
MDGRLIDTAERQHEQARPAIFATLALYLECVPGFAAADHSGAR